MRTRVTAALIAVGSLSALALAGCADEAETTAPGTDSGTTTEGTSTEPDTVDQSTCLIGDWLITEAEMNKFYDALEGEVGGGFEIDIEGDTGLSFTATDYVYAPNFTLALTFDAGIDGTGSILGTISGDYAVADGIIGTSHNESNVAMSVNVGGVEMDGTDLFDDILAAHPFNEAPYVCAAGEVVIDFSTGEGRVPITLTPAS
jgi:hypothetical protein